MRCPARRLFTLGSALSLLLCVAVCVLWARSYWVQDVFWAADANGRFGALIAADGRLTVQFLRFEFISSPQQPARRFGRDRGGRHPTPAYTVSRSWAGLSYARTAFRPSLSPDERRERAERLRAMGAELATLRARPHPVPDANMVRRVEIIVEATELAAAQLRYAWEFGAPGWLPLVLCAVLPAAWLRGRASRRRTARVGKCRRCGYDLRATPGRCPECGRAAAANSEAPAAPPG